MKLPLHHQAKPSTFRNARSLKRVMTPSEKILWKVLRDRRFEDYKFRRQQPISNYILDFYCHQAKLVIEVDGEIHQFGDNPSYDANRTAVLESLGLTVIRFRNKDVIENLDWVLCQIESHLVPGRFPNRRGPSPPRKGATGEVAS